MALAQTISKNVKKFRKEAGLSQAALSKRTGLAIRTISSIENRPIDISVSTLEILSKALGVPTSKIVRDREEALQIPPKAAEPIRQAIKLLQDHLEQIDR